MNLTAEAEKIATVFTEDTKVFWNISQGIKTFVLLRVFISKGLFDETVIKEIKTMIKQVNTKER